MSSKTSFYKYRPHDGPILSQSNPISRLVPKRSDPPVAVFGEDQRINYSPFLQPILCQGIRAVVIDTQLKELEPAAFEFLLGFARDNDLKVRPGRCEQRLEPALEKVALGDG